MGKALETVTLFLEAHEMCNDLSSSKSLVDNFQI